MLFEFGGTVAGPNLTEIRKQRAGAGSVFQEIGNVSSEANYCGFDAGRFKRREFAPRVGNRPLLPVNVLSFERGGVTLRGAGVPEKGVKVAALGIALASEDGFVLVFCNRTFLSEDWFGPE